MGDLIFVFLTVGVEPAVFFLRFPRVLGYELWVMGLWGVCIYKDGG